MKFWKRLYTKIIMEVFTLPQIAFAYCFKKMKEKKEKHLRHLLALSLTQSYKTDQLKRDNHQSLSQALSRI